ncbi:unnamed protein product [Penicillium salamii]|nr:unnamed protein product [Penicillium salamii]
MKLSMITLSALLGLVSAQNAVVKNHCAHPYMCNRSLLMAAPLAPSPPSQRVEHSQRNSENLGRLNEQTVKISKTKTLSTPLFFGYSFSTNPDYAYCNEPHSLSPGDGCEVFDCAANDAACYSTPAHKKVYGCPQPVTLTADLCQ